MKRAVIGVMLLCFATVVAMGAMDAQAYINAGVAAKNAGDHTTAAVNFAKAAEVGKGKLRCVGLRCYIYSLTKAWTEVRIVEGDKAAVALETEYAEDGDARVARMTWWNRRGFEFVKLGKNAEAVPLFEKSIAARQDFPMVANNLAVALCDLADASKVPGEKVTLAQKALDLLAKYKVEGKLAETKTRAEGIVKRAK